MATKHAKVCFGSELRRLRLQTGMSLRLLARRCSISPVYLSDIENNRKPAPSVGILHALIQVLHADGDELMSLAVKSVEQYGGTARKPRLPDTLSADEYLLVMKKKQELEPEEFRQWLHSNTIPVESKSERKLKKHIRDIVLTNLQNEQPLALDFGDEFHYTKSAHKNGAHERRENGTSLHRNTRTYVAIRHYEGQSEKEAIDIYIDTCYREWRSIKTPHARDLYISTLQASTYVLNPIILHVPAADVPLL